MDDSNGFRTGNPGFTDVGGRMPQFPSLLPGNFDPKAAMEAMMMNPMAFFSPQPPPGRRRQRCRDYDTKGYCARGNTCMFQHGDDPVYLPNPAGFGAQGLPQPQAVEGLSVY